MRLHLRKLSRFLLASSILAISLSPINAGALSTFKVSESKVWGHTYAGKSQGVPSTRPPKVAYVEAKARFVVNYKNFPEWAKKDFQAAVDIWSQYFSSVVPIKIDATFGRSASYGVLGSARPGNYYSGFDGAPDQSLWYPSALANALAGKDLDRKSTRLNSSHSQQSRMPSSA